MKNKIAVVDILNRLKALRGIKKDSLLCQYLKVTPATISNWKARNTIPYNILFTICEQEGISFDWLLTGKGDIYKGVVKEREAPYPACKISLVERILALLQDMTEEQRRDILRYIEEKKYLTEIIEKYKKKPREV